MPSVYQYKLYLCMHMYLCGCVEARINITSLHQLLRLLGFFQDRVSL